MVTLNKLSPEVIKELHLRLKDEFSAFYFYRSASNWCKNVGFEIAAKYFAKESEDELVHAKKLEDFIIDWNLTPSLPIISSPILSFKTLGDIIDKAYQIEYKLYSDYELSTMEMMNSGNLGVYNFLSEFLAIQTKSVGEYSTLVNKLTGVDLNDKSALLMIEETLFEN